MASKIGICNLALSHLGIATEIATFTEKSKEARACNRFYVQVRDEVLRDFPWPFATQIVDLALVAEAPNSEWDFSYRYPTDCLKLVRLLNGVSRIATPTTRVPHRVIKDSEGLLILTDQVDAQMEYLTPMDDPNFYPPDFVELFALLLASYIAPRVAGGDQFKLGDRALKLYAWRKQAAQINVLAEEQADLLPESEFITVRDS